MVQSPDLRNRDDLNPFLVVRSAALRECASRVRGAFGLRGRTRRTTGSRGGAETHSSRLMVSVMRCLPIPMQRPDFVLRKKPTRGHATRRALALALCEHCGLGDPSVDESAAVAARSVDATLTDYPARRRFPLGPPWAWPGGGGVCGAPWRADAARRGGFSVE